MRFNSLRIHSRQCARARRSARRIPTTHNPQPNHRGEVSRRRGRGTKSQTKGLSVVVGKREDNTPPTPQPLRRWSPVATSPGDRHHGAYLYISGRPPRAALNLLVPALPITRPGRGHSRCIVAASGRRGRSDTGLRPLPHRAADVRAVPPG